MSWRWLSIVLAVGATLGCCTVRFRVPAEEVARLADLPAPDRGCQVRVVPWATPPTPTMGAPAIDRSAGAGEAPTPERPAPLITARPVAARSFRGLAVARPIGYAAPPRAPPPSSEDGPPLGSLQGARVPETVVVVVATVAVASAVATVVDAEAKDTAFARAFDGWVTVSPWQKIHLQYGSGAVREIPLMELVPADAVGLRSAHFSDADGFVRLFRRAHSAQDPGRQDYSPAPRSR